MDLQCQQHPQNPQRLQVLPLPCFPQCLLLPRFLQCLELPYYLQRFIRSHLYGPTLHNLQAIIWELQATLQDFQAIIQDVQAIIRDFKAPLENLQAIIWDFKPTLQDLHASEWDNTQDPMNTIQDLRDKIQDRFTLFTAK